MHTPTFSDLRRAAHDAAAAAHRAEALASVARDEREAEDFRRFAAEKRREHARQLGLICNALG